MLTIRVKPSAFNSVYYPHLKNDHRYQLYYGGSSSGKSFFLATRAVLDCLKGRNYLVVRKVAKTLRGSCWNEILKAISRYNLNNQFRIRQSDMIIEAKASGAQIVFAGLDDVEKIKSITPAKGVFTDIWMEEATECDYGDYKQLDKRLRGLSKFCKRFTLSFNPVYLTHWIYIEFFNIWDDTKNYAATDKLSILKTTHKDNRFLAPEDHEALENEKDEYFRNVYTYGNGVSSATSYSATGRRKTLPSTKTSRATCISASTSASLPTRQPLSRCDLSGRRSASSSSMRFTSAA